MAYKSLFQPISEDKMNDYRQRHFISEGVFYDPRAIFEEEAVQVQGQPQAQPQAQPTVQQSVPQPNGQENNGQQPQAQPQQGQGEMVQFQLADPQLKPVFTDQTWKTFQGQPTFDNFKIWIQKVNEFVNKMGGGQQPQQGQQPQAQPQQPQGQVASQVQPQQGQQPTAQNSGEYIPFNRRRRMFESEDDGSDEDEPKKETKKTSNSETSSSSKKDEFGDTKDVKYDGAYKKEETTVKDYGWDKIMRDSIFGGKEDDFDPNTDVKYSSEYDKGIESGDMNKEKWNITPTKAEPYNPEKPSFTSLSNPTALGKTVFTTGSVNIKDAPTVAPQAPAAGAGDSKTGGSNSSSSSSSKTDSPKKEESKSEPKKESKSKDDGSDDTNESFFTNYDSYLNESSIEDNLKRTVVQEFLNKMGGEFDLGEFNDWLMDNYPQFSSDPNLFDEISSATEQSANSGNFNEEDTDETIENEESEVLEEITLDDAVEEYMSQYTGDEYDEDDAIDWFESQGYEDADDESLEDFLDLVSSQFAEDDINESFDDEFFSNEPSLNE